jgi:hypothetical protein
MDDEFPFVDSNCGNQEAEEETGQSQDHPEQRKNAARVRELLLAQDFDASYIFLLLSLRRLCIVTGFSCVVTPFCLFDGGSEQGGNVYRQFSGIKPELLEFLRFLSSIERPSKNPAMAIHDAYGYNP